MSKFIGQTGVKKIFNLIKNMKIVSTNFLFDMTVGPNSNSAIVTLDASLAGFKPIGIIGHRTSNEFCYFSMVWLNISNSTVDVVIHNSSNSDLSIKPQIYLLYINQHF